MTWFRLVVQRNESRHEAPRPRGDYKDFYPVAALIHAGYVATDSSVEQTGRPKLENTIGYTTKDVAHLCQLALANGQSFNLDGVEYRSWADFPVSFFLSAAGYSRLQELNDLEQQDVRRRADHLVALGIAIIAAVLSGVITALAG